MVNNYSPSLWNSLRSFLAGPKLGYIPLRQEPPANLLGKFKHLFSKIIPSSLQGSPGVVRPDALSKALSLVVLGALGISFGLLAYLPSALSGDVDANDFTISQSLAYSIKPAFVAAFTVGCLSLFLLVVYRGHAWMRLRLLMVVAMCALTITIVWVTTHFNTFDHYMLAGTIFLCMFVFITMNTVVQWSVPGRTAGEKVVLGSVFGLAVAGLAGLGISGGVESVYTKVKELFPAFENFFVTVNGLSILTLGFV